jgi:hypothetical protein
MAFTLLQLYNRALDMVGQPGRLTSITDVTPTCETLNRAIEFAFTEFVRTHDWNWAKVDVALVATTDPAFGWAHAFTLPTNYVAAVELNDIVVWGVPGDLYEIRAGLLLTDAATANLVYIRKPIATTSPSVTFATAAEAMLAVMDPLAVKFAALKDGVVHADPPGSTSVRLSRTWVFISAAVTVSPETQVRGVVQGI